MVYRFTSGAAGDVLILGPIADRVLRIIGREPALQGIIEGTDIPPAIEALERAVAAEESAASSPSEERGEAPIEGEERVTLRQRAWPLIDMMRRSDTEGEAVVWSATG